MVAFLIFSSLGLYSIVLTSTVCVVGALLHVLIPVIIISRKLAHIPGPPCHGWISGQGSYFRKLVRSGRASIMFDAWLEWSEAYGPVFKYRHYHKHVVPVVHDVYSIKRLLHDVNNKRCVFKDSLQFYMGKRMLGHEGILLATYSEKWKIKKRILRQFLNPRSISKHEIDIKRIIDRSLDKISVVQTINIMPVVQDIATDIMGMCLFNLDFGCSVNGNEISSIGTQISNACFKIIANPIRKLPFCNVKEKNETYRNITKIRNISRSIIEERSPLTDAFTVAFDDIEGIIDDINSLLFAGQDTTSNVMTYALANLAYDKNISAWLKEEIDEVSWSESWDTINSLPRLDCVVKETMRLYPSAPVTLRNLHKDEMVCGYKVPAGSTVWLSPYTVGRHPALWDNPTLFRPQRFLNTKELPKGQYFPFMAGPHECSGKYLAMIGFKMVIFRFLKKFDIELLNDKIPHPHMSITLHPGKPVLLRFKHIDSIDHSISPGSKNDICCTDNGL